MMNGIAKLADTSEISIYQNGCIDKTYILWKFGEDICYQSQMPFIFMIFFSEKGQCCQPAPKTVLKIKYQATLG